MALNWCLDVGSLAGDSLEQQEDFWMWMTLMNVRKNVLTQLAAIPMNIPRSYGDATWIKRQCRHKKLIWICPFVQVSLQWSRKEICSWPCYPNEFYTQDCSMWTKQPHAGRGMSWPLVMFLAKENLVQMGSFPTFKPLRNAGSFVTTIITANHTNIHPLGKNATYWENGRQLQLYTKIMLSALWDVSYFWSHILG